MLADLFFLKVVFLFGGGGVACMLCRRYMSVDRLAGSEWGQGGKKDPYSSPHPPYIPRRVPEALNPKP